MHAKRNFLLGLVLFAAFLMLSGCGGGGASSIPDPRVRFVNASPDATSLDLMIDDDLKASQIGFLTQSPVTTVKAGHHYLVLNEDGNAFQIDSQVFTFVGDTDNIVLAFGLENFGTENIKRLRLFPFKVNLTAPNGNKSRLIIVHTFMRAPGFETPAIDFQNPGNNPQFSAKNINFGAVTTIDVDSGAQSFEARRTGTENVYASATTTLAPGKVYLAIVGGVEGGGGNSLPQITFMPLN